MICMRGLNDLLISIIIYREICVMLLKNKYDVKGTRNLNDNISIYRDITYIIETLHML